MDRASSRSATSGTTTLFSSLCLVVPLAAPFDAVAESTTTAAITPQEAGMDTEALPERYIIGRLVGIEGRIEFTDHPRGRQGVAKDEAYVIQQESGERVRVVLQDDTLVEPRVDVGDRVLTFFDEHGKPTTIWEVP